MLSKALLLALAAQRSLAEIVSYWGNGGYDPADGSLADWCGSNEHIDILILAFLENWGEGQYPNGNIGSCTVNPDGSSSGCDQLASDIGTCQSQGKKVFVSLRSNSGSGLNSQGDAEGVAYSLWNSWGSPNAVQDTSKRPLGDITIDGWDMDLESDPNNEDQNGWVGDMLIKLREYFEADTANTYYIGGAPQCYLGSIGMDGNMGVSINQAKYDYLWIQFYNNGCEASCVFDDNCSYNFNQWPGVIANGNSKDAKLLVGLPGNTDEAPADPSNGIPDNGYVSPSNLPAVYDASKGVQGFSGFMVYEVGDTKSDGTSNGCDYFGQLNSVLTTGNTC